MTMTTEQATSLLQWNLGKLENEHKAAMAVLEHLPEDKLGYTPSEKIKPFGELLYHAYTTGMFFADIIEKGKLDFSGEAGEKPAIPTNKKDLAAACQELNQAVLQKMKSLPAESLVKEIPMGDFGTFPGIAYFDWHLSHLIHHRAQLTVYLRTMGAKVPATYGDSLDYPMSM